MSRRSPKRGRSSCPRGLFSSCFPRSSCASMTRAICAIAHPCAFRYSHFQRNSCNIGAEYYDDLRMDAVYAVRRLRCFGLCPRISSRGAAIGSGGAARLHRHEGGSEVLRTADRNDGLPLKLPFCNRCRRRAAHQNRYFGCHLWPASGHRLLFSAELSLVGRGVFALGVPRSLSEYLNVIFFEDYRISEAFCLPRG